MLAVVAAMVALSGVLAVLVVEGRDDERPGVTVGAGGGPATSSTSTTTTTTTSVETSGPGMRPLAAAARMRSVDIRCASDSAYIDSSPYSVRDARTTSAPPGSLLVCDSRARIRRFEYE